MTAILTCACSHVHRHTRTCTQEPMRAHTEAHWEASPAIIEMLALVCCMQPVGCIRGPLSVPGAPCKKGQNTTSHRKPKPAGGIGPWGCGNSAPPGIGPSDPACPAWRCQKPCQARNRHGGGFRHARTASGRPGRWANRYICLLQTSYSFIACKSMQYSARAMHSCNFCVQQIARARARVHMS